jgi:hypothetical protein
VSPPDVRPVSLAAPRIVVEVGDDASPYRDASLRGAPDAPGIEQALAGVVHLVAVDGKLVDPRAFEEERSLLLKEGHEHAEVEHGGVLLDLPEIRIHRAVEREVRRQAVLEIGADG